jgi:hypothetical protein
LPQDFTSSRGAKAGLQHLKASGGLRLIGEPDQRYIIFDRIAPPGCPEHPLAKSGRNCRRGCGAVYCGSRLQGGLPYQPWAAQLVKTRSIEGNAQDPLSNGLPVGPAGLHTYAALRKIIQVPGLLVILNDLGASYRQIFTDGRPLATDPSPTWNGYSIGQWDGDVLVVHTNGLRDGLWLDFRVTEPATITERFRRVELSGTSHLRMPKGELGSGAVCCIRQIFRSRSARLGPTIEP